VDFVSVSEIQGWVAAAKRAERRVGRHGPSRGKKGSSWAPDREIVLFEVKGKTDLEVLDGVLEYALEGIVIIHDEVGNVPVHEEFARIAADDLVGSDASVRAACEFTCA